MTVFFNKGRQRWIFDFVKGGKRYQGNCVDALGLPVKSRSAAVQAEGVEKRRVEIEPKVAKPGELTFALAVNALTPVWETQPSWFARQIQLRELIVFFGVDAAIASIDQAHVDDYVTRCRTAKIIAWEGGPKRDPQDPSWAHLWKLTDRARSPATVNLYLGTLRQIFARAAAHRDPRTGLPVFAWLPTVPKLRKVKRKARPMPDLVADELMSIMPQHVVDAMVLTALFGFRSGEVFGLKRTQIDWDHGGVRLLAEDVKDKEDDYQPASQYALGYLRCLDMDAEARGLKELISWQPKKGGPFESIARPGHAWGRARAFMRAKYGRTWRWHDLRAAFITHVAMESGPQAAQTMARHSDQSTTQGYIAVADEHRRMAADRISARAQLIAANESPLHDPLTLQFAPQPGRRKALK